MEPERFIEAYQDALGTQKWSKVERLIAKDASVTFSDGTVHLGKEKVQKAFQRNFDIIKSETYTIDKVKWLKKENDYAVYIFE
ncbi:MAG: nuclear transport factor 2 family protein, partial [Bacteroidota bacterium]